MTRTISVDEWSYDLIYDEKMKMEREAKEKGFDARIVSMRQALHSLLKRLLQYEHPPSEDEKEENIVEVSPP